MTDPRLRAIMDILERQEVDVTVLLPGGEREEVETYPCILGIAETARAITALDGWRPITTAPRDGTMIEVIDGKAPRRRFIAGWENDGWRAPGAGHVLRLTHWRSLCAPPAPEPQP